MLCSKEDVEDSVAAAHSDPSRDIPLEDCHLPTLKPHNPFNMTDFTLDDVRTVVKKA